MLVQWWRHFITLSYHHMVTGSKQTNHTMNRMIPQYFCVCYQWDRYMAFQQQIWSPFVIVLWFSKTKITDRTGILVLVRVLWDMISKIYWKFWHSFFQNTLESSYNFCPTEITWRKMVRSFCLTPVSLATWRLHTLWHHCTSI